MIFYFNNKISNEKNNSKLYYYGFGGVQGFAAVQSVQVVLIGNNVPINAGLPLNGVITL
jgi:hypothetical protein